MGLEKFPCVSIVHIFSLSLENIYVMNANDQKIMVRICTYVDMGHFNCTVSGPYVEAFFFFFK